MIQKLSLFTNDTKLFKVDGSTADCEGLEEYFLAKWGTK